MSSTYQAFVEAFYNSTALPQNISAMAIFKATRVSHLHTDSIEPELIVCPVSDVSVAILKGPLFQHQYQLFKGSTMGYSTQNPLNLQKFPSDSLRSSWFSLHSDFSLFKEGIQNFTLILWFFSELQALQGLTITGCSMCNLPLHCFLGLLQLCFGIRWQVLLPQFIKLERGNSSS